MRFMQHALTIVALASAMVTSLYASEDPPTWILRGILRTESRSYYKSNGIIAYIDKQRGTSGERGCFQITPGAFNQVKRRGEQFWMVEQDTKFCQEIAVRYLKWLNRYYGRGDWYRVIEMYNAGPNNHSRKYLRDVIKNSEQ